MTSELPSLPNTTRFICTIGPPTLNEESLRALAAGGMNIARINGSHGSLDDVRRMLGYLRDHLPEGVSILLDLPGNKIRTDNLTGPAELKTGSEFILKAENVTYRPLYTRVKSGFRISAADGAIQLEVTSVKGTDIHTKVLVGGLLENRKGLNIRGIQNGLPFDFERDIDLLSIAMDLEVDYVGLSFVRSSEHVRRIKAQLVGTRIQVVAKVETTEAVDKLERILDDADIIMVDRGDLEADIGREQVPLTTRRVVKRARERGVPVIVASQFLMSMMDRPLPFMAEVSDMAHSVLDGASFLMLSEETAIGKNPVEAISVMSRVARSVEASMRADHQVIILAAGPSTGFGSLTTNKHKAMLDVGGTTIIQHQLDNLRACGIPDGRITMVTGHNHQQIEHYLRGEGFKGNFIYNPWYQTTNILVSLWLSKPKGNTIALYGDIIFDPTILIDVLACRGPAILAVDTDSELSPEDEKVRVGADGLIVDAGKELDPGTSFGEFIGLARFDGDTTRILMEEMEKAVRSEGLMDFLTVALVGLVTRGVPLTPCLTDGRPWNDNDMLSDLDRSREKIFPRILAAAQARGIREIPQR